MKLFKRSWNINKCGIFSREINNWLFIILTYYVELLIYIDSCFDVSVLFMKEEILHIICTCYFFSRKLSISLKREETNEGQRNNYMFQYSSFVVSYQTDFIKYIKCHYVIKLLTLVLCQKPLNIVPQTRHTLFS